MTMTNVAEADSELAEVEYNLEIHGLHLAHPFIWATRAGTNDRLILATIRETKTGKIFVGEGPQVVDAINAAYHKAKRSGLRNSRLS